MADRKTAPGSNGADGRYKEFKDKNSKWHNQIEKSVEKLDRAAKRARRRVAS